MWVFIALFTSMLGLVIYFIIYWLSSSGRQEILKSLGASPLSPAASDVDKISCPNCNTLNNKSFRFCSNCGKNLQVRKLTKEELIRSSMKALDQGDKELAKKFMDEAQSTDE